MSPYPETIREQIDGLFQQALKRVRKAKEDSQLHPDAEERILLTERLAASEASVKLLSLYVDRLEAKEAARTSSDELPRIAPEQLPVPEGH